MASTAEPSQLLAPDLNNNQNALRDTFSGVPFTDHARRWDAFYQQDFFPWDRAGPSLALADLLTQRPDLVPPAQEHDHHGKPIRDSSGRVVRHTALVPGCGRGHDVLLLASFGYDTHGLDYSADAIRMAKENQGAAASESRYQLVDGVESGDVTWASGDFFSEEWSVGQGSEADGKFDLIFDYTFLCALPLDARPKWAARMSSLLSSKGRLVCLEFPSGKSLSEQGPPWGLTPEVYEALLAAPGGEISYDAEGRVVDDPISKPHDAAVHRLSLIKPRRTHRAGTAEDGSVTDFISVWSR